MTGHGQNRPGWRVSEEAVARWREEEEVLAEVEEAANRDPVAFAKRIPKCIEIMWQDHNDYVNYLLDRFGVRYRVRLIGAEFRFRETKVVAPGRIPRTRREKSRYETARHQIMKLEAIISVLLAAVEGADATPGSEERATSPAPLT